MPYRRWFRCLKFRAFDDDPKHTGACVRSRARDDDDDDKESRFIIYFFDTRPNTTKELRRRRRPKNETPL
jgi:hypothetical protein